MINAALILVFDYSLTKLLYPATLQIQNLDFLNNVAIIKPHKMGDVLYKLLRIKQLS